VPLQSANSNHSYGLKGLCREAALVAVAGIVIALVANFISPRGLKLTRNYFPTGPSVSAPPKTDPVTPQNSTATNPATNVSVAPITPRPILIEVPRLAEKGLQAIDLNEASRLFQDPARQQNRIVFVDVRSDVNFELGHIAGAYQLDLFHPDKYLATVLPLCRAAELVVVYCTGGDCEDSESGALLLRDAGIANEKVFIYTGGITEWESNSLPVETGARGSGTLKNPVK
jgi:rhodanese-related sulfurtransferase